MSEKPVYPCPLLVMITNRGAKKGCRFYRFYFVKRRPFLYHRGKIAASVIFPAGKDFKMIFLIPDQTVCLHAGQFSRKGAPVRREIIGHLLPAEGDIKGPGPLKAGLIIQIGKNLLPYGFLGDMIDFPGEKQVFAGQDIEQIADQTRMEGTGIGTGGEYFIHIQKEDGAAAVCPYTDRQRFFLLTGIAFAEEAAGFGGSQNTPVPPDIFFFYGYPSGQNQSHLPDPIAGMKNIFIFLKRAGRGTEALKHGGDVRFLHPLKKKRVF